MGLLHRSVAWWVCHMVGLLHGSVAWSVTQVSPMGLSHGSVPWVCPMGLLHWSVPWVCCILVPIGNNRNLKNLLVPNWLEILTIDSPVCLKLNEALLGPISIKLLELLSFKKQSFCLDSGVPNSNYTEQHTYVLYKGRHFFVYVPPVQLELTYAPTDSIELTTQRQTQFQTKFHSDNKIKLVLLRRKKSSQTNHRFLRSLRSM